MRKLLLVACLICAVINTVQGGCGGRRPPPPPQYYGGGNTNCGGHRATSCSNCPNSPSGWKGRAWCNGDCDWVNNGCHPCQRCQTPPPPPPRVDCQWTAWHAASGTAGQCDKTCGGGNLQQTRRYARYAQNGGRQCYGPSTQTVPCNTQPCPGEESGTIMQICLIVKGKFKFFVVT